VTGAFRDHLGQAGPDDAALFFFSGHGAQQKTAPEFLHLEPDGVDETLVCVDSRQDGRFGIADKELARLIADVAATAGHVLVVLDCCFSGSGTRTGRGVRLGPADRRPRAIGDYLVDAPPPDAGELPHGPHVLLAACRSDQLAREMKIDGKVQGVFTHAVVEMLSTALETPTYRDMHKRTAARVAVRAAQQTPQLAARPDADADRPVLGGAIRPRSSFLTLVYVLGANWMLDAGAAHGVPAPVRDATTVVALYSRTATPQELRDPQAALGRAAVTAVLPARSRVRLELPQGTILDVDETYRAVLVELPVVPLAVAVAGDAQAVEELERLIDGSPWVAGSAEPEAALRVDATAAGYRVLRPADERAVGPDVVGTDERAARRVLGRLEHVARWTRAADLANPASQLPDGAVRLTVHAADGTELPAQGGEIALHYTGAEPPLVKLQVTNVSDRRLYCMLADLTETYGVFTGLLPSGGAWLGPGESVWAFDGEAVPVRIPEELVGQGVGEFTDVLKLIVATEEADAGVLAQGDVGLGEERSDRDAGAPRSTVDAILRGPGAARTAVAPSPPVQADWSATEVVVRVRLRAPASA
jgi:hypothetical protein